tara:strand:+ start:721 stop:1557 length:837 start_codon:yes stop_codon:yes gene_type:complete
MRYIINFFLNHYLKIFGVFLLLLSYEIFAWYVYLDNPRFANRMFPRLEYIFFTSYPEFATYYGLDQGLIGFRKNFFQATLVLIDSSLITILRLFLGVGLGILLGVGTGLLLGISPLVREISLPPILLLRTIPIMALIPLFLFWFGTREIGIIIFVIFAVFSIMIVSTLEAIRNVPRILLHHAQCLGATKMQAYRTVVIPYILPALNGSIRVILGISFALVLAGELLATDKGLGWLMILSERYLQTGRMLVIVIIFIIYAIILNITFIKFSNKINHWKN